MNEGTREHKKNPLQRHLVTKGQELPELNPPCRMAPVRLTICVRIRSIDRDLILKCVAI